MRKILLLLALMFLSSPAYAIQPPPNCAADGNHAEVYNTTTNAWTCIGVSGSGAVSLTAGNVGIVLSPSTITGTGTISLGVPAATTLGGVKSLAAVSHQFLTSITTAGAVTQAAIAIGDLPSIGSNTLIANATSAAAVPTAVSVPSCATSGSALLYTLATGFSCNTSIAASTVTTNANLTGVVTSVGNATTLGSFSSANLRTALTDETGTGADYFQGGDIGTPSAGVLTNATGLPLGGIVNIGSNTMLSNWGATSGAVAANTIPACAADGAHALTYTNGTGMLCTGVTGGGGSVSLTAATTAITLSPSTITGTGTIDCTTATASQIGCAKFGTGLGASAGNVTVNTSQSITILSNLTGNGFVKTSGGTGTLSIDTSTYLTGNQTITLSGDTTGSGTTAITTTTGKVNGVSYPASPSTNTVPVVTGANTITYETVPNAALANSSLTVAGHSISLGGSSAIAIGDLTTIGSNTIVGNSGATAAVPSALAAPSCSTAGSALQWTTATGLGCNTSITAAAVPASGLTGTTLASNVVTSSLTAVGTITTGVWSGTALVAAKIPADVAYTDVVQQFTKSQASTPVVISNSSGTYTPDLSTSNNFSITLVHANCSTGCTLANSSVTPVAGASGTIAVIQSSTGSDTISTFGTNYVLTNAAAPIYSTAASAVDYYSYYVLDATHVRLSFLPSTTPAVQTAGVISTGTKFTVSGCSATATSGGATAGIYTSGTTGTCTTVITMNGATGLTAPNGWSCYGNDITTPADLIGQSASTQTTATLKGTTISGDVINFGCIGY